jgi:LacI family transcriptional regulator
MATIREIAQKAGVGIGTVDRVLHDRGRVSEETADRVKRIAHELGFVANPFARNLKITKPWVFGLLMPNLDQDSGYWRLPFSGAHKAAAELSRYRVSLRCEHFDRFDTSSFHAAHARLLLSGVDGILMAPVIAQAALEVLERAPDTPHVAFDTELDHPSVLCRVGQDSYRSGALAGRLMSLLTSGRGPWAVLRPETDNRHIGDRVRGFAEAVGKEVHVAVLPQRAEPGAYLKSLRETIGGSGSPSGILVADATTRLAALALGSMREFGNGGRPALVGFDLQAEDAPFLESGDISFLITQAPRKQGEIGVMQLFKRLVLNQPCDSFIPMPIDIVTKENYQEHMERGQDG